MAAAIQAHQPFWRNDISSTREIEQLAEKVMTVWGRYDSPQDQLPAFLAELKSWFVQKQGCFLFDPEGEADVNRVSQTFSAHVAKGLRNVVLFTPLFRALGDVTRVAEKDLSKLFWTALYPERDWERAREYPQGVMETWLDECARSWNMISRADKDALQSWSEISYDPRLNLIGGKNILGFF